MEEAQIYYTCDKLAPKTRDNRLRKYTVALFDFDIIKG
jgi:hypothetical protein